MRFGSVIPPLVAAVLLPVCGAQNSGVALLRAAKFGDSAQAFRLLELGAPVNVTDVRGMTALSWAAAAGNQQLAAALVKKGAAATQADARLATANGYTALAHFLQKHYKAEAGSPGVVPEYPGVSKMLGGIAQLIAPYRGAPFDLETRAAAERARSAVDELLSRWENRGSADTGKVPPVYLDNLLQLGRRLSSMSRVRRDDPQLKTMLNDIAADLHTKLAYCIATKTTLGGLVQLRVHTRRGPAEVPNWQVFFLPKMLESAPGAEPDLFPKYSSPTDISIPPGRYVIWAREASTRQLAAKLVVRVGGSEGVRDLELDLPVP
jgi:hypothetical protein